MEPIEEYKGFFIRKNEDDGEYHIYLSVECTPYKEVGCTFVDLSCAKDYIDRKDLQVGNYHCDSV